MIWHVVLISLATGSTVYTLPLSDSLTDQQARVACSKNFGVAIKTYLKANPPSTHNDVRTVKAACQKF
jgi:hypothetical protein